MQKGFCVILKYCFNLNIRQKTAPSLKNRFQLTQVNYNISRCTINIFFVLVIWLMFPESVKSVFVALNKFWSLFLIRAWSPTPRFSETADLLLPTWAGFQGLLLFKPKDNDKYLLCFFIQKIDLLTQEARKTICWRFYVLK